VAAIAFQIAKEPLQDVVGSLGLDGAGPFGSRNDQRVGEQFGTVVIDLLDHLLQNGRGGIIGTRSDFPGKGLNVVLEGLQLEGLTAMIEALVSAEWSDPQGLAHLIEQRAVGFQAAEGVLPRTIFDQVLQVQE